MLKNISLILGALATLVMSISSPARADDEFGTSSSCPPGWMCFGGQHERERREAEEHHEELMEELQRPRQCFTERDIGGRLFTWCN